MSKHTKGPLRLNYLENGAVAVECDPQTRRVATFHHQGNPKADAKLFIAAPELLEAAKVLVEQCLNPNFDNEEVWRQKIGKMEMAIAKAEGRE